VATWLPRICARRSMRCVWSLYTSSTIARRQSVTGAWHDTCTHSTGNLRIAGSLCCPDSFSGRQVCPAVLGSGVNDEDIDGPAPTAHVHCQFCSEWKPADIVEFLDIQEDIDGKDIMIFSCPSCKHTVQSFVVLKYSGD